MYVCAIDKVTNIYNFHLCDDYRSSGDDPTDTFKFAKNTKVQSRTEVTRKRSSRAERESP